MYAYGVKPHKSAVYPRDFGQDASGNHHRHGNQAANEPRDRPPSHRAQEVQAGALNFPVERVGLDEQANPNFVDCGVRHTENKSVQYMTYQRAEDSGSLLSRPIQGPSRSESQERQGAKKPPEDCKPEPPSHARSVAADVLLEENAKRDADQQSYGKMHENGRAPRAEFTETRQ